MLYLLLKHSFLDITMNIFHFVFLYLLSSHFTGSGCCCHCCCLTNTYISHFNKLRTRIEATKGEQMKFNTRTTLTIIVFISSLFFPVYLFFTFFTAAFCYMLFDCANVCLSHTLSSSTQSQTV